MLRGSSRKSDDTRDQPILTVRALVILTVALGLGLVVGAAAAFCAWIAVSSAAGPGVASLVTSGLSGLGASVMTTLKALGVLHRVVG